MGLHSLQTFVVELQGSSNASVSVTRKSGQFHALRHRHSVFPDKKFGFIQPDKGADIFFHVSAVGACDPQVQIEVGQAVKYELMTNAEVEFGVDPREASRNPRRP